VVDGTTEVNCPGDGLCGWILSPFTIDFDATQITFRQGPINPAAYTTGAFNGLVFSDLDFGASIAAVTLSNVAGLPGLDETRVTLVGDTIFVNLQGISAAATSSFTLDLAPVPVPAAALLFPLGLAGIAAMRKRKTRLA
jgi:hypothetical protein